MQTQKNLYGLLARAVSYNSSLVQTYKTVIELENDAQESVKTLEPNMTSRNNVTNGDYSADNKTQSVSTFRKYPDRLKQIFRELKQECKMKHDTMEPPSADGPYCNRTIDGFGGCWPDTMAGHRAKIQCPAIPSFNSNEFAYRNCTMNGTWYINQTTGNRWANYTGCFEPQEGSDASKYIYIFIGGFVLSLIMLIVSLVIFFRFRQLRCDRITIHKNLFLSYVFTGLSWILYYVFAALNGDIMLENPVWCQALHVVCQYFIVCNFLWMFCEGLYLNTVMVYAFNSGKLLIVSCYIIGWGVPVILTVIYAVVRSQTPEATVDCWLGESVLQWIMYGPVVISISVNALFLINIVRLLITKLRQMPEADQTRKATRATLILVPLLGLQYLLFPIRPAPGSDLEEVYHITVALLVSLQGAFVSTMYCFCNGEVITVLRRKWNQHRLMSQSSMRGTSAAHATNYTTMDPVTQANTTYFSTADNKEPPLEMAKLKDEDM